MTANCVLDASALLVALLGEKGNDQVKPLLGSAMISAVNWSEVLGKLYPVYSSSRISELFSTAESVQLHIVPFDGDDAKSAAKLVEQTNSRGLSLGDRACLALAQKFSLPAITADRAWSELKLGVKINVIR